MSLNYHYNSREIAKMQGKGRILLQKQRLILCMFAVLFCLSGIVQAAEPSFRQGDKSPEIVKVKLKMKEMGYIVGDTDDFFSWKFAQAVKVFQYKQGLKADGVIDSTTYLRIMKKPLTLQGRTAKPKREAIPTKQKSSLLATAKQYIGTPYKFGGTSPKGFDCSGFVQFVFKQHSYNLPRGADSQFTVGKPVQRNRLQPGDLVFFTTYESGPSHNGIYLEKGQFIHASSSRGVMISNLSEAYWKSRYLGARRVL